MNLKKHLLFVFSGYLVYLALYVISEQEKEHHYTKK